ncbi:hypothetical protein NKG05_11830 [Oerskovia sp. M15]
MTTHALPRPSRAHTALTIGALVALALTVVVLVGYLLLFNGRVADGATRLDDGATRLEAGAAELADGAERAEDGAGKLADGSEDLKEGRPASPTARRRHRAARHSSLPVA